MRTVVVADAGLGASAHMAHANVNYRVAWPTVQGLSEHNVEAFQRLVT